MLFNFFLKTFSILSGLLLTTFHSKHNIKIQKKVSWRLFCPEFQISLQLEKVFVTSQVQREKPRQAAWIVLGWTRQLILTQVCVILQRIQFSIVPKAQSAVRMNRLS